MINSNEENEMKVFEFFLRNGTRLIAKLDVQNSRDTGHMLVDPYEYKMIITDTEGGGSLWYPLYDYLPASKMKNVFIEFSDLMTVPRPITREWKVLYFEMLGQENKIPVQTLTEDLRV